MAEILTDAEIAELETLERGAVSGPWDYDHISTNREGTFIWGWSVANGVRWKKQRAVYGDVDEEDCRFICAARNAMPKLLASHAALAKQAGEMRDAAATLARIAHLGYGGPNLRHAIEQVNTLLAATAAKGEETK